MVWHLLAIVASCLSGLIGCAELGDDPVTFPTAPAHTGAASAEAALEPAEEPCADEADGIVLTATDLSPPAPIGFDLYAPGLAPETLHIVDAIARRLVACPDVSIEIQVHTSTRGTMVFNARSSQAIAAAIRQRLVGAGVPDVRLAACGYGESKPDIDGGLEPWDGRQKRVRFRRLEGLAGEHACPVLE